MNIFPTSSVGKTCRRSKLHSKFHWRGWAAARCLAGIALAGVAATGAVQAANTQDNVVNGQTDLTLATTYSAGLPTATSDVVFTNLPYNPAAFTLNTSLSFGTLNDLSPTALTIQNTAAGTTSVLTLNGGGDSVSGSAAADLLYVANGGNLSLGGGAGNGALNLTLATAGNFNIVGTANISSAISASGLAIAKNGAGTLNLLGAGTSATGRLTQNAGTINFGSATDAPTYTATDASIGVFVVGGNFNMVNGSLTSTSGQGLVLNGNNTYAQTGGAFSTNGRIEFANGGGTSTVNISSGSLTTTASSGIETVRGTTTISLSGTGTITTPLLDMTTTQLSGGAAGSTFNLNGGTLVTGQIIPGANGTTGTGTIFNFNGGTLQASASSATFMQGLTNAFVLAGGAIINTNGFNDTITQSLLTSATSTGGGLTKNGAGTLTLSGTDTYTGATGINAGTLQTGSVGALGSTSGVTVANGAALDLFGNTPTTSAALTLNGTGISSGGALLNSSATAATYSGPITLGSSSSIVANSGGLATTGPITVAAVTGTDTLTLSGTGTVGNDIASTLSDTGATGGLIVSKTGTGTWTLGGSGTSTLAKGQVTESAGTLNFGSATEAPSLTISAPATGATTDLTVSGSTFNLNGGTFAGTNNVSGGTNVNTSGTFNINGGTLTVNNTSSGSNGVGVYVTGGSFNLSGGSVSATVSQGLVLTGTQTYAQTGGAFNTSGLIEFANNSGSSTVNISGGTLKTSNTSATDATDLAVRGTSTVTLSGTGVFTTPVLNMSTSQISGGAAGSTFNLNSGGTLVTNSIIRGTNSATGTTTFNFNGGTLQASTAGSTTFMQGLTAANVQAGGAVINTNGFNDTIGQTLTHDPATGAPATDGGLTKQSAGTLILLGANTYTGTTTVSGGTLSGNTGSYGSGAVTVAQGATVDYTQGSGSQGTATNAISGQGTATFGNVNAGNGTSGTVNYTGQDSAAQTNVQSGTVTLNRTGGSAISNGPVAIATGATVTLGSDTQIATAAPGTPPPTNVALSGGTLIASGHSDGTISGTVSSDPTTSAVTSSIGTLSLTSGASTFDFGAGSTNSIFAFADSASSLSSGTGTLNILNYTGLGDAIYIGTTNDLTSSELARINFNGIGATQLSNGQLAAAPEPSAWAAFGVGLLGLGGLIVRARRRHAPLA